MEPQNRTFNVLNNVDATHAQDGASYNRTGSLLESKRNLLQPGADQAFAGFRTLLTQAGRFSLNGVIGALLNTQFEATDLVALLGPAASTGRSSATRGASEAASAASSPGASDPSSSH